MIRKLLFLLALSFVWIEGALAQIGEYRNVFSIGASAGYVLSDVGFDPTVSQSYHGGVIGGVALRYTCEKYFKTICSVYAEVNYASIGWKQDISKIDGSPVVNANGKNESFTRNINYIQIPLLAHLAWGKEQDGINFFVQAGPQIGIYLSDSAEKNYDTPNLGEDGRANTIGAQETMPIENKLDYGIAAGLGLEYSKSRLGHFLLEARYYYGLGDIYGNSKRDFFGKSNFNNIVIKAAWMFDVTKTKNSK
mgnify:FL=1